jgi:outer membrane protein assembly factor BamB
MARLILRYPNNAIKEVDFNQPRLRIGTAADNDVVVENEDVEEHQAEIETRDGAFSLKDLSENNSTTVNGKTFETISITYGDRIAFGPVVGLFYPPQKSKMGQRSKLMIFMAAGAGVLIVAIALIFLIVSRPDYTDVTSGAALVEGTEDTAAPDRQLSVEEIPQRRSELTEIDEQGQQPVTTQANGGERTGLRLFSFLQNRRVELLLQEPSEDEIEKRQAVAIPRGLGRLFFRKRPVAGIRADVPDTEAAGIEEAVSEALLEEVGEVGEVEEVEETLPIIETVPEAEIIPDLQTDLTAEGEVPEDEGAGSRLLAPFRRIGNLFGGEAGEEALTDIPLIPTEIPVEEAAVLAPETTQAPAEAEPAVSEVPEVESIAPSGTFVETPVYSPEELKQAQTGFIGTPLIISQQETVNSSVLWSYSLETEASTTVIVRSGMIGLINDNRYRDFVVGTAQGELLALDGELGEEIFREDLGEPFFEPLLQDMNGDGKNDIAVIFESGAISAYSSRDTLDEIWRYNGDVPITAAPAMTDVNGDKVDDIVVATLDMDVIALDGRTGFELWRFFDAETEIHNSPVAVDLNDDGIKDILFSTRRGFLYAVDGSNGWGLWKSPLTGRLAGPPTLGDLDDDGDVDIVTLSRTGTLSAYSKLGRLLSTREMEGDYNVAPSVGDSDGDGEDEIIIVDDAGLVRAIEGATRKVLWQVALTEGPVNGRIVLGDLNGDGALEVLLPSLSGALAVLDGRDGMQEALFNSSDRLWATPLVDDLRGHSFFRKGVKSILIFTEKGLIYSVRVQDWEGRLFSFRKTSWVSAHHDSGNTGYVQSGITILPWK